MAEFHLMHRRADGTFVVEYRGYPYHVVLDDPLYPAVAAAAEGVDLPPEPVPDPIPAPPQPTPAETAAARAALDALVAAGLVSAEARAQMSPGPV